MFTTENYSDSDETDSIAKIIEDAIWAISNGESEKIGDIYEVSKSAVYGFILSILKNPTEAEDVMQDTYVKICVSAHLYQPQGKPMAWIFTIARNLALMKIRSSSRNVDIPEFEWEMIKTDDESSESEDRIVLTAALNKLSSEESEIVMLHAVGGMKHREIAEVLDMPLATVLSKYNRALKKLKVILAED